MAILLIPENCETIIIEEANNSGHREDQSPRYVSDEVADYWHIKRGINVIKGENFPSTRQLKDVKENKIRLLNKNLPKSQAKVEIVDLGKEKNLFSIPVMHTVEEALKTKKSILFFITKKGLGGKTKCTDCHFIQQCPNCHLPLATIAGKFTCPLCNFSKLTSIECPKCGGINMKNTGWGIEKVIDIIQPKVQEFGGKLVAVTKENPFDKNGEKSVFIATQAVFRYQITFDYTIVLNADWLLNKPDYSADEHTLQTLANLTLRTNKRIIIQTHEVENSIFASLKSQRYYDYYIELMRKRSRENYPPYGYLIKITYKDESEKKAEEKAEKAAKKITANVRAEILGPTPAWGKKNDELFYWQIILKSQRRIPAYLLRDLVGDGQVEFNPISLLD
jgi:primosomal protein N' (replication factor Y)